MSHGETEKEALESINEAMKAWIETALQAGDNIPLPESIDDKYSGKFIVRIPKELHRELSHNAEHQGVSLNQYVQYLLSNNNATIRSLSQHYKI